MTVSILTPMTDAQAKAVLKAIDKSGYELGDTPDEVFMSMKNHRRTENGIRLPVADKKGVWLYCKNGQFKLWMDL